MNKLGILLDSFSGISKKELNKLGFEFIAQIINIDGKEYKDGENIFSKDIINKINNIKSFKTSMPAIGEIIALFKKMSQKYENVIFITMHKGMSSTFSASFVASKSFKNVHVISTKLISRSIVDLAQRILQMAKKNQDLQTIFNYIKEVSDKSKSYIIPKNLDRILASGRLTGFKKLFIQRVKLIPKLFIADNEFEVKGIARNFTKTCKSVVMKMIESIGGLNEIDKYYWAIVSTGDSVTNEIAKNAILENGIKKIEILYASVGSIGHSGVGSIGLTTWPKK